MSAVIRSITAQFQTGLEHASSAHDALSIWDRKAKSRRRNRLAIVLTVVVYIGFLLASPSESISKIVVQEASSTFDFLGSLPVMSKVRSALQLDGVSGDRLLHLAAVLAFFSYFMMIFGTSDPLSNQSFLSHVAKVGRRGAFPWYRPLRCLPELEFYAKDILPSGRIHRASDRYSCSSCLNNPICPNRLDDEAAIAYERWREILGQLEVGLLVEHLSCLLRCRSAFQLRYGIVHALLLLLGSLIVFRLFEYARGVELSIPIVFVWYWAAGLSIFWVVGRFNPVAPDREVGVWVALKENTERLLRSGQVKNAFAKIVCRDDGNEIACRPQI